MNDTKVIKLNQTCPLRGTTLEGYCVDNTATIEVATGECDHKEDCIKLKADAELAHQGE